MKVSSMRNRITIERAESSMDDMGNIENAYTRLCDRWAYVNKSIGREDDAVGTVIERESLTFTIRCDSQTRSILPGTHRILFKGRRYNIISVDNYKMKNESLKIHAELIRDSLDAEGDV